MCALKTNQQKLNKILNSNIESDAGTARVYNENKKWSFSRGNKHYHH